MDEELKFSAEGGQPVSDDLPLASDHECLHNLGSGQAQAEDDR